MSPLDSILTTFCISAYHMTAVIKNFVVAAAATDGFNIFRGSNMSFHAIQKLKLYCNV